MPAPPESPTHEPAGREPVGHEPVGHERGTGRPAPGPGAGGRADQRVDAESAASFPASDPPSDWAGADGPPDRAGRRGREAVPPPGG